jgi:xanthine dehydrogenase YagR molybdenum-binding subunit
VYYAGQHIAMVVATTFEQATHAAMLVRATYDAKPPRASLEKLAAEAVPKALWGPPEFKRGDAAGALASAAVKVDELYTTPIEHHNMMEPHALVARWDGDKLTVNDSSQFVFGAQKSLATAFGIEPANVRVLSPYVGGGFGCKGEVWPHVYLAVAAARKLQRPVKISLTRKQLYTSNGHRSDTQQRVAIGASQDGKLTSIIHESTAHTSMIDSFVEPCPVATNMMYATPAIATITRVVQLNQPTPTFMRAPGEST